MDLSTLKTDLHKLIEEVDDEKLLEKFYQEVVTMISNSEKIWEKLSRAQQHEVLKAFEESKNKSNLVDHKAVMKKYEKWL